ncbi:MAG TPA: group 1 truncated hemoglobin [Kofleriaceae bacterium]|nr:group 1 truncated hemoglobin [Kofleriaceae bacterium]
MTLHDRIGDEALRRILRDFYDRVFADPMIGFLFDGKNKERLIQKEAELVAQLLGGAVEYSGRSMAEAHRTVRITTGHFDRRLVILEETLADHAVEPEVRGRWLEHARSLREQLTADPEGVCPPPERSSPGDRD